MKKGILILLGAVFVGFGAEVLLRWAMPLPAPLREAPCASTEFLARNGEPLRMLLVEETHYSHPTSLEEISPHVIAATIAAEDARFFYHPGFDPLATARAALNRWRGHIPASGASTITQQLVKESGPRTWRRKLHELLSAVSVERQWSKKKILIEYLNRLDYGNLHVGIAAASHYYFAKPPSDLSAAEAAFLAALPQAPSRLNPHKTSPKPAHGNRGFWIG